MFREACPERSRRAQRDSAIYETSSNFRQSVAAVILGVLIRGDSTKTKVKTRLVTRTLRNDLILTIAKSRILRPKYVWRRDLRRIVF
jgi:hypothetical protein